MYDGCMNSEEIKRNFGEWWKTCDKIFTIHDLSQKNHLESTLDELAFNIWKEATKQALKWLDNRPCAKGEEKSQKEYYCPIDLHGSKIDDGGRGMAPLSSESEFDRNNYR